MARQQKTAGPKQKFSRECMECGQLPRKTVVNGRLVTSCDCDSKEE